MSEVRWREPNWKGGLFLVLVRGSWERWGGMSVEVGVGVDGGALLPVAGGGDIISSLDMQSGRSCRTWSSVTGFVAVSLFIA